MVSTHRQSDGRESASDSIIFEAKGRGMRKKTLSTKAQEALEETDFDLPGLAGHQENLAVAVRAPNPAALLEETSKRASSSRQSSCQSSMQIPEPSLAPQFPAIMAKMLPPHAPASKARGPIIAPDGTIIPSFTSDTFQIYPWPAPVPKHFFRLSDKERAWKEAQDVQIPEDDGADDWFEFSGNVAYYPPGRREYAIAGTFVMRAKRAYRNGVSWYRFEQEELAIDSSTAAKTETDQRKRRIHLEEDLDNDLRLAVLEQLKIRLCNEIWLQIYTGKPERETMTGSSGGSPEGEQEEMSDTGKKPKKEENRAKKDETTARNSSKQDSPFEDQFRLVLPAWQSQREDYTNDPGRTTVGWAVNDQCVPRPFFKDEVKKQEVNGIDHIKATRNDSVGENGRGQEESGG